MTDEVNIRWKVDDRELDASAKKVQGFGPSANQAMKEAGGGITGLLGGISQLGFGIFGLQQTFNGLKGAIGGLFSSNVGFEQMEVQFKVLLGSADAAKARMNELAIFAKDTPFELPNVVKASKVLQTFGGDALATGQGLTLVGDVAAGVGVNIDELAMWFGRLYDGLKSGRPVGEAMMRLQELGAVSGTTRSQIEAMQAAGVDGEVVWQTFAGSMGKYSGMMKEQSQTVGGALSNISDGFNMMKRNLMQGLFEAAKPGIMAFATWLGSDGVQGAVKSAGEAIGEFVTTGVKGLVAGFQMLAEPVGKFIGWLKDSAIGDFVRQNKELVAAMLAYGPVGAGIVLLKEHWDKVKDAAGFARDTFLDVKDSLSGIFDGFDIGTKFTDLKASISDIGLEDFIALWEKLKDALQPAIDVLKPLAEDVLVSLKDAVEPITKAFKEDLVPALVSLQPAGEALLPLLEGIGKLLGITLVAALAVLLVSLKILIEVLAVGIVAAIKVLSVAIIAVGDVIKTLAPIVTGVVNAIVPAIKGMADQGKAAFDALSDVVRAFAFVWPPILAAVNTFMDAFKLAWEVFKTTVTTAFDLVKVYLETGFGVLKGLFNTFIGVLTGDWKQAWDGVKQIVESVWEGIKGVVRIGLDALQSIFTNWFPAMKQVGHDLIQGIRDGLEAAWHMLPGKIQEIGMAIPGMLGNVTDWLVNVGWDLIRGLVNGITAAANTILQSTLEWVTSKIPSWKGPADKDAVLLYPTGRLIIGGLAAGISDAANDTLKPQLDQLGRDIATDFKTTVQTAIGDAYKDVPEYVKKLSPAAGYGGSPSNAGPYVPYDTPQYIGGGQYGASVADSKTLPIGTYNASTNLTWTGTGWIQGNSWKPGDMNTLELQKFWDEQVHQHQRLDPTTGRIVVQIGSVTVKDENAAQGVGSNIGYGLQSQLGSQGVA